MRKVFKIVFTPAYGLCRSPELLRELRRICDTLLDPPLYFSVITTLFNMYYQITMHAQYEKQNIVQYRFLQHCKKLFIYSVYCMVIDI